MNLEKRIEAFSVLGIILRDSLGNKKSDYHSGISEVIEKQQFINKWFTPDNVRAAISAIAGTLTAENLRKWTDNYPSLRAQTTPLKIGLIFAGNVPAVGFHDYMSVLISGNNLIAKTSSKDPDLLPFFHKILCDINPDFLSHAGFTSGMLSGFDAVIATGSNNTARYFEYYFGKYPNIIRKNRSSVAIIDGTESDREVELLGKDIFSYFGLGCRNVSKIYLPRGYEISRLTDRWSEYSGCINHSGYANNYDYNKAVYLINRQNFHDTGYILIKEDSSLSSPVAVLHMEYYDTAEDLNLHLKNNKDNFQCVVGRNHVPFGRSQMPDLWDYADGIDTLDFLLKKNFAGIL
ncbi:MAG TPA: acyl-CoA reductase [Bacteroidales bacterium]|nr:acyl-CoA reductase [Bacteroidales bacterium]